VDTFVAQVARDRADADGEIADLRTEVDRLHRYIRRQWAAVAAAEAAGARSGSRSGPGLRAGYRIGEDGGVTSPAAQARAVLTQAQEIAERRLRQADERLAQAQVLAADRVRQAERELATRLAEADEAVSRRIASADDVAAQRLARVDGLAEQVLSEARKDAANHRSKAMDDAHQLLQHARNRYEEIVIRAHRRADRAAEVALHEFEDSATDDAGRARAELELKAAYLRTFAKVSRAALHAALDVTAREFDRLLGASALIERSIPPDPAERSVTVVTPAPTRRSVEATPEAQDEAIVEAKPATKGPTRASGPPKQRVITLPDTQAELGKLRSVLRVGSSPLDPTAN
jgi:hypothetical protein